MYEETIEKVELSKIGQGPDDKSGFFLNIYLKDNYIHKVINSVNKQKDIMMNKA